MPHKIKKVMGEFKRGTLKSSSGDKVTDKKQALAIALWTLTINLTIVILLQIFLDTEEE